MQPDPRVEETSRKIRELTQAGYGLLDGSTTMERLNRAPTECLTPTPLREVPAPVAVPNAQGACRVVRALPERAPIE